MLIKVCGMKYQENILEVCQLDIDFIGFIFYKNSPRYVGDFLTPEIINGIPDNIKKIGVFVNSPIEEISKMVTLYNLSGIQLHGNETPDICEYFKKNLIVIKAFSIKDDFYFSSIEKYVNRCDYFLFDTYTSNYGGSGRKFRWEILGDYKYDIPFFLSGGISFEDVDLIRNFNHPQFCAIDINSKFEVIPGLKDVEKIKNFISLIKNNN